MKKRSLAGNVGIAIFIFAFICVVVAFASSAWLVSDQRISNAQMDMLGLWRHCFRSLPNPVEADAPRRFFVGCRWIYDPFTTGYSEIRGFLVPWFMVFTQLFYTLCFIAFLASLGMIILYSTCWDVEQKYYTELILTIGATVLGGGICGCIGTLIFATSGNTRGWMPGHDNNFFGWSFVVAVVGSIVGVIAGILFFVDATIQRKKMKNFKESQTRFTLESRT